MLEDLGRLDLGGISWVIVGGESGPGARPMEERWVLSIRDQCRDAGVPSFFKQWGGVRKKARGRLLEGVQHDAMPARIRPVVAARPERLEAISEVESRIAAGLREGRAWSSDRSMG